MTQINANAAASLLGIKVPQVSTLIRRGLLKRLNTGTHARFIQVDFDQVMKLKEKHTTAELNTILAMRSNASKSPRLSGATNAAIMSRLDRIDATMSDTRDAILNQIMSLDRIDATMSDTRDALREILNHLTKGGKS